MPDDLVLLHRESGVAVLTLNRPEALNALDTRLMRALVEVLHTVANDDDIRCVVLTGAGKGFCAGGDTRAIAAAVKDRLKAVDRAVEIEPRPSPTFEKRVAWVRRSAEASRLLHEMPKPTIAMINGACAGAGMSLAAACDFRIAAASAKFRSAFSPGGVSGDYGGSWLWTHILGTAKARQLYLIDRKREAAEALEFGLVDEVHADEALSAAVMNMAAQLAALPGRAASYIKSNLNAALTENFVESLARESMTMMLSRDAVIQESKRRAALKIAQDSNDLQDGKSQHVG